MSTRIASVKFMTIGLGLSALGVVQLFLQSRQAPRSVWTLDLGKDRYAFVFTRDQVAVKTRPRPTGSERERLVSEATEHFRHSEPRPPIPLPDIGLEYGATGKDEPWRMHWVVLFHRNIDERNSGVRSVRFDPGELANPAYFSPRHEKTWSHLHALDDDYRFLAAHLSLSMAHDWGQSKPQFRMTSETAGQIVDQGVVIDVTSVKNKPLVSDEFLYSVAVVPVAVDPSQRQQIREFWIDRLYLPTAAVRVRTLLGMISTLLTVMLLELLRRFAIRVRRRRRGLCEFCGYDLCATPGKCPECGNVPAVVGCRRIDAV